MLKAQVMAIRNQKVPGRTSLPKCDIPVLQTADIVSYAPYSDCNTRPVMHSTDPTSAGRSESEETEHLIWKEQRQRRGKPWGSYRQETARKGEGEVIDTED